MTTGSNGGGRLQKERELYEALDTLTLSLLANREARKIAPLRKMAAAIRAKHIVGHATYGGGSESEGSVRNV